MPAGTRAAAGVFAGALAAGLAIASTLIAGLMIAGLVAARLVAAGLAGRDQEPIAEADEVLTALAEECFLD